MARISMPAQTTCPIRACPGEARLLDYNKNPGDNPLGLYPQAHGLIRLTDKFGKTHLTGADFHDHDAAGSKDLGNKGIREFRGNPDIELLHGRAQ
jgi:hypothetical protein